MQVIFFSGLFRTFIKLEHLRVWDWETKRRSKWSYSRARGFFLRNTTLNFLDVFSVRTFLEIQGTKHVKKQITIIFYKKLELHNQIVTVIHGVVQSGKKKTKVNKKNICLVWYLQRFYDVDGKNEYIWKCSHNICIKEWFGCHKTFSVSFFHKAKVRN